MEILEKSSEAIIKEEKKAEKKPEKKLKLPEETVRRMTEREDLYGGKILVALDILSHGDPSSSKYNKILKRMLFDVLEARASRLHTKAKSENNAEMGDEEEDKDYLHQSFDEFFSPLVDKEKNEEKLKELNEEKHGLVRELEKINKYQLTSKSQKKEKASPIETRLLELSRLRKQLEEKLRSPDVLLEFIPGYRKDFEEFDERLRKTPVPEGYTEINGVSRRTEIEDYVDIKQEEKNFRENWVKEKLNKKLEKMRKDLEGLL